MAKQRITLGSILEINIKNEYFTYAQILTEADCAFFDYKTKERLTDLSVLEKADVLFIVAVYDHAITTGRWAKIGTLNIRQSLKNKPMKYIQDSLNPEKFELYDPNTGNTKPARKEDCIGLEKAAVWEPEHVEQRIADHYEGKPNVWVEKMKIK